MAEVGDEEQGYLFALAPRVLVRVQPQADGSVRATVMPADQEPFYVDVVIAALDGVPLAREVKFWIPSDVGGGLTSADLRLPLTRLVSNAWHVAEAIRAAGPGGVPAGSITVDNVTAFGRSDLPSRPATRISPRETAELMRQVVEEYRAAVTARHPAPTQAVAAKLGYSRAHIGRLLVQARREGLLAPALPGRPGEAPPKKRPGEARPKKQRPRKDKG